MITFSLQSGSNGNAIYVEAGGVRLLIDAGISGKLAEGRMRVYGRDIQGVDALLISHDHNDHVRCCGVYQRKFRFPIYMTRRTHEAIRCELGPLNDVRYFTAGDRVCFNGVTVHSLRTPHDAVDGVAFVVEHEGRRLGILTDLGHPFAELRRLLPTLDAAYLESNYDPQMLACGAYPAFLKDRIRGMGGHLSNDEAAALVGEGGMQLKWVALSHLSGENNDPGLAVETHHRRLGKLFPVRLAPRHDVSELMEV